VQVLRIPRGVLTRVIVAIPATVATTVVAVLFATLFVAAPAGAAGRAGHRDDSLAPAAAQALADLRASLDVERVVAETGMPIASADVSAAYQADLTAVAALVAPRTDSPAEAFTASWSQAGSTRMTVLLSALAQVGVPYRRNTSSPDVSFDCSGFTMYAWSQVGVDLAHQDRAQIGASAPRNWDTASAGDLVDYPGHVMMFVGAGHAIVHAPNTGSVVTVRELTGGRSVRLGSPIG
jgi:cell wall-associated NlpC family hydrolase